VSAELVQKSRRGRPPKRSKANEVLASGHPQEHPVAEEELHPVAEEEVPKRRPGRPRIHPVAEEEAPKRQRGRPPKPKAEAMPRVCDAEASQVQMSGMGFMFKK
jgi:hypothetical protein